MKMLDNSEIINKTVCIVGVGKAGFIHQKLFLELGMNVILVDKRFDNTHPLNYNFVTDIPAPVLEGIDFWSVCSPTAFHYEHCLSILNLNSRDKCILIEKPLCCSQHFDRFSELLKNSEHKFFINDIYKASSLLDLTKCYFDKYFLNTTTKIEISFVKDRFSDQDRGRFIDKELGVLGYEWMHMLACLVKILPQETVDGYLNLCVSESKFEYEKCYTQPWREVKEFTFFKPNIQLSLISSISRNSEINDRYIKIVNDEFTFLCLFHQLKHFTEASRLQHKIVFVRNRCNSILNSRIVEDNHFKTL